MTATLGDLRGRQDVDGMIQMSCDLVNISSETGSEAAIADYVAQRFVGLGMSCELQEVEEQRSNVIARLVTGKPGPTLMFLAHFDTSTNPDENLPRGFQPNALVQDGWISGLGISNMKCAFAAYYSAIQLLQEAATDLSGEIVMAGVVGEIEKAPVDAWQGRRYRGGGIGARVMLNRGVTADYCINGEPTGLRLQLGNAGYMFLRISLQGSPQATFSKHLAIDPIPVAWKVWQALQDWESAYQRRHPHEFMRPLVNVGAMYGGYPYKPSISAPFCNLYVHANLVPGQSILGVQREIEDVTRGVVAGHSGVSASVRVYLASNGHQIDAQAPVVQAVSAAHKEVFGNVVTSPPPERYSVSSDNSPLAEYGIPAVTYGAGGINLSGDYSMYEPGLGEVVSIENLARCAQVYAIAASSLLSEGGPGS